MYLYKTIFSANKYAHMNHTYKHNNSDITQAQANIYTLNLDIILEFTKNLKFIKNTKQRRGNMVVRATISASWLATCVWKPKVPGSNPAASYVQR